MTQPAHIVYVASRLPARSETFVYRELLEMRRHGVSISHASVRRPERSLGTEDLENLADEALEIYDGGVARLVWDAVRFVMAQPQRGLKTIFTGIADAAVGRQVPIMRRPKLILQMLAGLALAQRLAERNIVASHFHAHMAHVPTSIAMYAAIASNATFSFTGHAADLFRDYSLLPAKLRRAKFVACISRWHRDFYRSIDSNLSDERLPVVRCGVDVGEFTPVSPMDRNKVQILAVGRLVEKKGFDILIRACAQLRDKGLEFDCSIVGDGPERNRLQQLIESCDLKPFVKLLGSRDNAEVRDLMMMSDLFVLPCRQANSGDRDGIPVVLMEAMACGVPVISGDLITIRELVESGVNGLMVPPENMEALANAMARLIESTAERRRLADAGRQTIVDEFSLGKNVNRLLAAFRAVDVAPCLDTLPSPRCHETTV